MSTPRLAGKFHRCAACAALLMAFASAAGAAAHRPVPLANAGFEQGAKGWTIRPVDSIASISAEQAASGRQSLKIEDRSKRLGSSVFSSLAPIPGEGYYELRGKVFPVSGRGLGMYLYLFDKNRRRLARGAHLIGLGGTKRRWKSFRAGFTTPPGAAFAQVWIHSYGAARVTAYLDDFEIAPLALRGDTMSAEWKSDMLVIKHRLTDLAQARGGRFSDVRRYLASQQRDGSWSDLNYSYPGRAAWSPARHVSRLYRMAQAFTCPKSPLRGDPALRRGMLKAYDWWTSHNPQCRNWWYNVIGVPRLLYRAMLLIESDLSPEQVQAGLKILKQAKLGMTGENLVWVAEVTIARGCIAQDPWLVRLAFNRLAAEIRITTSEGIQPDYSFYQHGQQFYSGGYGKGFACDCSRFAALARGTQFQFSKEKIDILSAYLLDGQQWLVRGPVFDYSACGREIARKGGGRSRSLIEACTRLLQLDQASLPRRGEIQRFLERLQNPSPKNALRGARYFWRVDYFAHHRPEFMASVRMTSPRTLQTETCNSENLLGRHLSDGLMYLYRRGDEYRGVFPVWDWKRLPGITCEQTPDPPVTRNGQRGERPFVVGATDGLYGAAAMDFARGKLGARKGWFFFDREVVCLGAGISCPTDYPVLTSVNQCRLRGAVTAAAAGEKPATLPRGEHHFQRAGWVFHDGVLYVLPQPCDWTVKPAAQTGSWYRINHVYKKQEISLDVFSLWIDHGRGVKDGRYAYLVAPGVSLAEAPAYAAAPGVEILSNTPTLQAVHEAKARVTGVVFWRPGSLTAPGGLTLSADKPCVLVLCENAAGYTFAAASPTAPGRTLTVKVNRLLVGPGAARGGAGTLVRFPLPSGSELGRSVVRRLRLVPR